MWWTASVKCLKGQGGKPAELLKECSRREWIDMGALVHHDSGELAELTEGQLYASA